MAETTRELLDRFSDDGAIPTQSSLKLILRSFSRASSRLENDRVDLKVDFKNDARSWPAILKDIVAMHNSGGGLLLLGVANDGSRPGLGASLAPVLDPTNVGNKAKRYHINGHLRTAYVELHYYRRRYGFLFVHPGNGLLAFDKDVQLDRPGTSPEMIARAGIVYVRRDSATSPARQNDLDAVLNRMLGHGVRAFLARVEKVASLPASTQLIAQTPGASSGYILTAAGQGVPVQVVGPASGAQAIALSETLLPDLPLSSIEAEVVGQLRQYNSDRGHRVQQGTLRRWYLSRSAMTLPGGAAAFLTLSALDTHGLPCYWASQMDRTELKDLVMDQIILDRYPARDAVPYLVACFFWDERRALLKPRIGTGVIDRICETTDRERYLRSGRFGGSLATVRIGSRRVAANDLYASKDTAQAEFDAILTNDDLYRDHKQVANQLDMWLHADR